MSYPFLLKEFEENLGEWVREGKLKSTSKGNYLDAVSRILEAVLQKYTGGEIKAIIKENNPEISPGWLDEISWVTRLL